MMRNLLVAALVSTGCVAYGISLNAIKGSVKRLAAPNASAPVAECESETAEKQYKDSDIAASVNDRTMTWKELNDKVDAFMDPYGKTQPIPEELLPSIREGLRKNILGRFITANTYLEEAKRLNITVSDEARKEAIDKITAQIAAAEPGKTFEQAIAEHPFGADAARKEFEEQLIVEALLKQEVEPKIAISDDEVKWRFEAVTIKAGETQKRFDDAQKALAGGTLFEDVVAKYSIVEQKLKDFPKENLSKIDPAIAEAIAKLQPGQLSEPINANEGAKARVKLVQVNPAIDDAAAKAKIEDIRKKLLAGGDFAALAAEHSICPSARKGGDLGTFGTGQMVPEFEDAAFGQEVGVVGPVIKTEFGYHIVKVTGKTLGADGEKGTVSASHILIAEAPESLDFYLLLIQGEPLLAATEEEFRAKLLEEKVRDASDALRKDLQSRMKITCIYPELLQ